jgi:hypothetical protein
MNDIILGAKHIMDFAGLDHMLFLIALAASFDLSKLCRMVLLATAFTIGHTLTLFLAGLDIVRASLDWVEFLIPVTILILSIAAVGGISLANSKSRYAKATYAITAFFGLIHGLGFSSFFRIAVDRGEGIVFPLMKFNLGVEIGQIIILLITLSVFSLARALGTTPRSQQIFIGGVTLGLSALMVFENLPV